MISKALVSVYMHVHLATGNLNIKLQHRVVQILVLMTACSSSLDLESGDYWQLVAAQQLLQCHADSLLGCIHLQNAASDLLAFLVLAHAASAHCVSHVHSRYQCPAGSKHLSLGLSLSLESSGRLEVSGSQVYRTA